MRVYELAKELGVPSKDLVILMKKAGFSVGSHMSVLTDEDVAKARASFGSKATSVAAEKPSKKTQQVEQIVTQKESKQPQAAVPQSRAVTKDPMINSPKNNTKDFVEKPKQDAVVASRGKVLAEGPVLLEEKEAKPSRIGHIGAFVDEDSSQEIFDVPLVDRKGQDKFTRIFSDRKPGSGRSFRRKRRNRYQAEQASATEPELITEVRVTKPLHLFEAAELMGKQASELILSLLKKGKACNRNDILAVDVIKQLAGGYGLTVLDSAASTNVSSVNFSKNKGTEGEERAPIVVVMGHVDHGKTTLLDYIRKKNIAATEKGGITQHLGAYEVKSKEGGSIVFLDTPGHEAFGYIRKQGAKITDLAVLVIAADDGIKPQTVEAIKHAREAEVPIIVAINKIDKVKSAAALETVKRQLTQYDLMTEDWGGQTICVPISGKTGEGVDALLDMIVLQSQMMDLKAHIARSAKAFVLESRVEKGYGPVATVICVEGTLKQGDYFTCGEGTGRVRLLIDSHGNKIESVGPSIPVQVIGFNHFSSIGEWLTVVTQQEYSRFKVVAPQQETPKTAVGMGQSLTVDTKKSEQRSINLIIKTDTRGSKEALIGSIEKLSRENKEINCPIKIVASNIGDISEGDVELAENTGSLVVGLHVKIERNAQLLARDRGVAVHVHQIIYHLVEFLQAELLKHKEVKMAWEKSGELVVRKVFDIKGLGVIAGCYVKEGVIARVNKVACVRGGKVIGESKISSLQRDKKSVKEVHAGFECGFMADSFNEWQINDTVLVYKEVKAE